MSSIVQRDCEQIIHLKDIAFISVILDGELTHPPLPQQNRTRESWYCQFSVGQQDKVHHGLVCQYIYFF